ncbi:MAG: HAMP domain-containing histidine kinase [Planctomycetes bacterium]|nr:HAMP domain-containing histidine kinase [Planctomycetota bacterium]
MSRKPADSSSSNPADDATGGAAGDVERHLDRLQRQLDGLRAQVRQAQQLAGLGTAAAMIAHEVNNLLTPIVSYTRYALNTDDTELHRKALRVTERNAAMLVAMADRVLGLTAASANTARMFAVAPVVQEAIASLCRDLSKDGITLQVNVDEELSAWGDPLHIQQVLFNVLLNARNAMSASHNGRLVIAGARGGETVQVTVRDTGPGIPDELLPYLFDPLQTSKPISGDGPRRCAGLGLALCRDLMTENGGTITAGRAESGGALFTLTLRGAPPA